MRYLLLYPDQWRRGSPRAPQAGPEPVPGAGSSSSGGADGVASRCPERAASPVFDRETSTFWPGAADTSQPLAEAQRSECVGRLRTACDSVPDPEAVGVSLVDLELEVARRVASTSLALSASRTLRDPDLELEASRSVTSVPFARRQGTRSVGQGADPPSPAPAAAKRSRSEVAPPGPEARRDREEEGSSKGHEKRRRRADVEQ